MKTSLYLYDKRISVLVDPFVQTTQQNMGPSESGANQGLICCQTSRLVIVIYDDPFRFWDTFKPLRQLCRWNIHRTSQVASCIGVGITQINQHVEVRIQLPLTPGTAR